MNNGRVLAVSDLHGSYGIWSQIKDFLKPDDILYVLGDCGDRGRKGWEIIKEVYDHPQTIYIKGNHEDMLEAAMFGNPRLCFLNGGAVTYEDWLNENDEEMNWSTKIRNLPTHLEYLNKKNQKILLSHAGYTPQTNLFLWEDEYFWNREHFYEDWNENFSDCFIIHGHTPISHMDRYIPFRTNNIFYKPNSNGLAIWYSPDENGIYRKCNIDCGTFFTGNSVVLNLDTFKEYVFKCEEDIVKGY